MFVQDCVKASQGTWIRMIRMDLVLTRLLPQGPGLQGLSTHLAFQIHAKKAFLSFRPLSVLSTQRVPFASVCLLSRRKKSKIHLKGGSEEKCYEIKDQRIKSTFEAQTCHTQALGLWSAGKHQFKIPQ